LRLSRHLEGVTMSPTQIMVVEDENIVAKDIQSRLEKMGYEVPAVAASGEEAIEMTPRRRPDLVLMDVMLRGDMRGTEAAEAIRTRYDIPVIYLTAYSDTDTVERAKVTEPYGYLLKPFDEQDLKTAIEMALYKHKMEQAIKAQKNWLATILRSLGDGVITVDGRGVITLMNQSAERMTGWTEAYAVGRPIGEVVRTGDADSDQSPAARVGALLGGEVAPGVRSTLLKTPSGLDVPVEHTVSVMEGPEAEPVGAVLVLRDVSERRKVEKEREKLKGQLVNAQKLEAIGHLTTGVAHNFGNALNVVLGNLELGLMYEPPERIKPLLETAKKACMGAADIVDGLRQFTAERQMVKSRIDAGRVMREVVDMCRHSFDPDIELEVVLPEGEFAVSGDGGQLEQALMNLCLNARDALEAGVEEDRTPRITFRMEEVRGQGGRQNGRLIRMSVIDNGVGMDDDTQGHLFEPFFTTKEVGRGTGLGLTTAYGIIEEHEGWIEFSSRPGAGTSFHIYLPAVDGEGLNAASEETGDAPRGGETVLIIDDDPLIIRTAQSILEGHGYTVLGAEGGEEGLALYDEKREQVDLIVLDMSMPRMSGGDVLGELLQQGSETRVIVVSGYAPRIAESMGVRGYLKKPFRARELLDTVRQVLDDEEVGQS
jgi:two-component system, cell cycle sensor histidine kinase and response regulator CckA